MEASERPDLSRLKPLWALYTKMLDKETGDCYVALLDFVNATEDTVFSSVIDILKVLVVM